MSRTHKFEEMLPREFRDEFSRAPVIYCPLGGVEYHGTHQSLAIDYTKGHAICLRTATIAGGIVHPVIPIVPGGSPLLSFDEIREKGADWFHAYPGVFGGRDLCRAICEEMLKFFAGCLNFKLCVIFGSHGPAGKLVKAIAEEHQKAIGNMRIMAIGSSDFMKEELADAQEKFGLKSGGAHGGLWETSMNMAIDPKGVDLAELDKPFDGFYEMPPNVTEENRHATAAFGEKLMNAYAERLAKEVRKNLDNL